MTENKFRERRSAFRDESAEEPEAPAGPAPEAAAERLERAAAEEQAPPGERAGHQEPGAPGPGADATAELDRLAEMDVPPASFLELVEPHVEMAYRFLGELPLTPDGERRVLPRWAKREIDLLGILEERTRGNLPAEEERVLAQTLDQLRTLYLRAVE